jgi:hypothetical protein
MRSPARPMLPHRALGATLLLALFVAAPAMSLALPLGLGIPGGLPTGLWEPPEESKVEAIHAILLPTGKVLYYTSHDGVRLLDPATGAIKVVNLPYPQNIFCSGHTVLADGRVLVMGGTRPGYFFAGEDTSFLFDPWTETWSQGPRMNTGRWYPTPVLLGDGRVAVFSGLNAQGHVTSLVEVLDAQQQAWSVIPGANRVVNLFPRMTLLPNGELLQSGHEGRSWFFNPASGAWRMGPGQQDRYQGSSVLLEDGRVLATGGAAGIQPASSTARTLAPGGSWEEVGSMALPRRDLNLVLAPDGDVYAFGGSFTPGPPAALAQVSPGLHGTLGSWLFRWPSHLVAERFDPTTNLWNPLAPAERGRTYHATALLLPDGRIWVSGSDIETNPVLLEPRRSYEVFSPPYLFAGPRPVIAAAPARVAYGASFDIATPDHGVDVAKAVLVRPGSVTHAFNFDQRVVALDVVETEGGLRATAPSEPNRAPPGYYMLFLISGAGVPSVARFVHLA